MKIKLHDDRKEAEYADIFYVVDYEKLNQKNASQARVFYDSLGEHYYLQNDSNYHHEIVLLFVHE